MTEWCGKENNVVLEASWAFGAYLTFATSY